MTLDEEKEKSRFDFKLQLIKIFFDKVLLGLVVVVLALGADMVLENYKDDMVKKRFLLESRLNGILAIRESYDKLSNCVYTYCHKIPVEENDRTNYQNNIDDFIKITNRWGVLFSDDFRIVINRHTWLHDGIASTDGNDFSTGYWAFAVDVFNSFDDMARRALWKEIDGDSEKPKPGLFTLVEWDSSKASKHTGKEYLDENIKKWKQFRSKAQ
jgi:hypothetical protein